MKMTMQQPEQQPLPGNSNLAKTKAASESKNRTRKVTDAATSSELNIEPKKSMLSKRLRTFSRKCVPGSSFGG